MIIYLLKSSGCIALFYLVYLVFFKYTDWFQLNRAYLLTGVVLSFIVPMIVVSGTPIDVAATIMEEGYTIADTFHVADVAVSIKADYSIIAYLYYFGAALALLITLTSVLKSLRLYWSADKLKLNNQTVVVDPNIKPFSFFGILFIRSQDEDPIIVQHEMVHIKHRHWIDLVVVEVATIILWFNPIMYVYRRSIAIQHEYIADREVIANVTVETYLGCITKQLESRMWAGIASRFNARSIKQRIIMATNTKSYPAFRYTIVLPTFALVIMAFATRETTNVFLVQNRELRCPVDAAKLKRGEGTGFGQRINPATKREAFHTGVDFVLAAGSSVYAAAAGTVVKATSSDSYGNFIIIRHDKRLMTSCSHLEQLLVKEGDRIEAGQLIGTVGSTGLSTGPHLHFEVLENEKAVDPVPYLNMSID